MSERRGAVLRGVYAVADTALLGPGLTDAVEAALEGGAALIQYRDKSDDPDKRLTEAARLQALCKRYNVPLIVNDDVELARISEADGVHLGEHDVALEAARKRLGPDRIIGVSCYNDLQHARESAAGGADYVAFGSVFPSLSKPGARRAPLSLFEQASSQIQLPLCAIGGISATNVARVLGAGANMAAVIHAVFAAHDVEAATRELAEAFRSVQQSA